MTILFTKIALIFGDFLVKADVDTFDVFCYLFFQHLVTLLLATVPTRDMIVSVQSLHFKRFLTLYFEIPVLVSSGLYNRRSYNILVCIDLFSIKSYPNMDAPLEQNPPALHLPRYVGSINVNASALFVVGSVSKQVQGR